MSFTGNDPYGTPGGVDLFSKPQTPEDVRKAEGRAYIAFLRVNGVIAEKLRKNVEDVVRVLGLSGEDLQGITIRWLGTVIDPAAREIDVTTGILVISVVFPGEVSMEIPANTITTDMITNLNVTLAKLAANSVNASKVIDASIGTADFDTTDIIENIQDISATAIPDSSTIDTDYNDGTNQMAFHTLFGGSGGNFGTASTISRSDHSHPAPISIVIGNTVNIAPGNACSDAVCAGGMQVKHCGFNMSAVNTTCTNTGPFSATQCRACGFSNLGGAATLNAYAVCQEATIV